LIVEIFYFLKKNDLIRAEEIQMYLCRKVKSKQTLMNGL
jgi:hypothetical protein